MTGFETVKGSSVSSISPSGMDGRFAVVGATAFPILDTSSPHTSTTSSPRGRRRIRRNGGSKPYDRTKTVLASGAAAHGFTVAAHR